MRTTVMASTFAASCALSMAACAGSETGNGGAPRNKRPIVVTMQLASVVPATLVDADGGVFSIDAAHLVADRIDFDLGEPCLDLDETVRPGAGACAGNVVRIDGPWVVDLLSGELDPVLEDVAVLDGPFVGVDAKFGTGKAGTLGIEPGDLLDGATFVVQGSHEGAPYVLRLDLDAHARFGPGEIATDSESVALSLDLGPWLSELTLTSCIDAGEVPTEDGVLQLAEADKRACGDVSRVVRQALARVGQARVD